MEQACLVLLRYLFNCDGLDSNPQYLQVWLYSVPSQVVFWFATVHFTMSALFLTVIFPIKFSISFFFLPSLPSF